MQEFNEQELAIDYVKFAHASEDSPEYKKYFWTFDAFVEICLHEPFKAWSAILAVLSHKPGARVMQILAAGPLEELLVNHGHQIIDQMVSQAKNDPIFAALLGGVWKNNIADDVWEKIKSTRSHQW